MYETLVFQNNNGVIQRICLVNYGYEKIGTLYQSHEAMDWFCQKLIVDAPSPHWLYLDLVSWLSKTQGNSALFGVADVMDRIVPYLSKAYIPEYTQVLILVYRTDINRIFRVDTIRESQCTTVYQSDSDPFRIHLHSVHAIQPITVSENKNIDQMLERQLLTICPPPAPRT